jgi:dUTP pyrophosphatase
MHKIYAFAVKQGDRVAQLILERIATPDVIEVAELDETTRGANGYGSTGVAK